MKLFGKRIPQFYCLVVWAVIWESLGHLVGSDVVPPFSDVVAAAVEMIPTSKFQNAALITVQAFAIGMALAIVIGIPIGTLMGYSKAMDRLLGMWVNIFVSAPLTAVVPVLMVIFGIGQATVIASVFLFAIWVIVLDTQAGVKHINPSLLEMARSFGAQKPQMLTKVYLLAALPEILAGIRLGMIRGAKGVVIGQLLVAIIGVGELFELYSRNFLFAEFWALIIMVFLFAFAASEIVGYLERRIEYYASAR